MASYPPPSETLPIFDAGVSLALDNATPNQLNNKRDYYDKLKFEIIIVFLYKNNNL